MNTSDVGNIQEFGSKAFDALINAVKISNELPSGVDYRYHEHAFPEYRKLAERLGTRVTGLMQRLCDCAAVSGHGPRLSVPGSDADDVAARLEAIPAVVDDILEAVDEAVDGTRRAKTQPHIENVSTVTAQGKSVEYRRADNFLRPQLLFNPPVNNTYRVFVPLLTRKPNAVVSLEESLQRNDVTAIARGLTPELESHFAELGLMQHRDREPEYPHPYSYELNHLCYPPFVLNRQAPRLYKSFEDTPLVYVDTVEGLNELENILEHSTEFAIDLEHHNYRSYEGFVCLMQLSTRTTDYIIDTLKLRNQMGVLLDSFTDPHILKVVHGCMMDIIWLQRDFGLYVVNAFDTGQAAKVLQFERLSLKFLIERFCGIEVDKHFQLADWRVRPLPDDMLRYARGDTHYLLYIYDRMKDLLLTKGEELSKDNPSCQLRLVLDRTRDICLHTYVREFVDRDAFQRFYDKTSPEINLSDVQYRVALGLFLWRDAKARELDESVHYVLPNQHLFALAQQVPQSTAAVLHACTPAPPVLRQCAEEIVKVIRDAAENEEEDQTEEKKPKVVQILSLTKKNKDDTIQRSSEEEEEEEEEQQKIKEELTCKPSINNENEDDEGTGTIITPQPLTTKSSVILEEKKNNFHGMFGDDEDEDNETEEEEEEEEEVDDIDSEENDIDKCEIEKDEESKNERINHDAQTEKSIKATIKTITNSFALPQETIDANEETREIKPSSTSPNEYTNNKVQQNATEASAQNSTTETKKKEPALGDIVALSIAEQYAPKRKRENEDKSNTCTRNGKKNKKSKKNAVEQPLPASQQLRPVDYSQYSNAIKGKVFVLKDKKGTLDLNFGKPKKLAKHQKETNVPFGKRIVKRKR